ncbi:LOW QUALITY PROTEIN: putative D-Tyr-tRNA(Tyr) deacylase [Leishmania naiffi]|uniref:D-Tyr-tRNA(Tyr) deacylase n=1 Tax=Leishmania naiffi TaxID=5678 RepID=A0AAW3BT59_9TRYP
MVCWTCTQGCATIAFLWPTSIECPVFSFPPVPLSECTVHVCGCARICVLLCACVFIFYSQYSSFNRGRECVGAWRHGNSGCAASDEPGPSSCGIDKYVHTGRGVMVYIAFISDGDSTSVTDEQLRRGVDVLLQTKIFTHFSPEKMISRPLSLEECPEMDILIVPQASLGGKVKGRSVQFHQLVPKDVSAALYDRFCHFVRVARGVDETRVDANGASLSEERVPEAASWIKYNSRVISGTFGNRQGLRFETDGPFTHTFDI